MCVRERTLLNDVGISGEESAFSNADKDARDRWALENAHFSGVNIRGRL